MRIDEGGEIGEGPVGHRFARRIAIADDEPGDRMASGRVVEEYHALTGLLGPPEHVAHLETDAVTRAGRLGDQHVAARQPVEIAPEHVVFAQLRFGGLDVISQEMRRQHVMPEPLQSLTDRPSGEHTAAITTNGAGEIDPHASPMLLLVVRLSPPVFGDHLDDPELLRRQLTVQHGRLLAGQRREFANDVVQLAPECLGTRRLWPRCFVRPILRPFARRSAPRSRPRRWQRPDSDASTPSAPHRKRSGHSMPPCCAAISVGRYL